MSAGKFLILIALSFMIIALVFVEVLSEAQVSGLTDAVSLHEEKLNRAQRQQEILRQMLQRLAVASLTDPALADFLRNHGVQVNHRSIQPAATAPVPSGSKPAPPPPDVPPVAE
jgi:hypothetical protein